MVSIGALPLVLLTCLMNINEFVNLFNKTFTKLMKIFLKRYYIDSKDMTWDAAETSG
jgi:hypothetical protein